MRRVVLFQEIDAAGIVFYARIFDWFHDAYVEHLRAHGVALPEIIAAKKWGAPLVHAEADFQRPFRFGDRISVDVVRSALGDTSLTVEYRITKEEEPNTSCATGRTVHVFIDLDTMRPRSIPEEVRAAFREE